MESSRCHGDENEGERRRVKEWMPTSNYWDPIKDRNEAFEIVDIRGFKKLGRAGYYLVQYKPRILDAADEFPFEFIEMSGRPWPLTEWLVTIELTWRIRGNDFLERRKKWFAVRNIQGIEVVLERRGQEYRLLREQKYKLLRELKKGEKLWKVG